MASQEYNLQQAKKAKEKAEHQIAQILWQFYLDTGLWVTGVAVEDMQKYAPMQTYKADIQITLR